MDSDDVIQLSRSSKQVCDKRIGYLNRSRKSIYQGKNQSPIEYDNTLAKELERELVRIFNNKTKPHLQLPSKRFPPDIAIELKRYSTAVEAYLDSSNPVNSRAELIEGISDINFATQLKNTRLVAFLHTMGSYLLEDDPKLDKLPRYRIKDIGDVFNFNYCFNWKVPEDDKDYMYGHKPVLPLRDDQKENIRRILLRELPDNIESVKKEEVLLKLSGSSSFTGKVWKEKERHNSFSTKGLKGRRVLAQTGPGTCRDTVVLPVDQVNSVSLIEKQCMLICEKLLYSEYRRDFDKINKNIDDFYEKYFYFYDRDIEKEGITKPREFIQVILDTLEEKYPNFPAWEYKGIYSSYTLLVEDGEDRMIEHKMERGHGLGMGNALTTIMQVVLFHLMTERLAEEDDVSDEISGMFYNDDGCVGCMNEATLNTIEDIDAEICLDYQVRRKDKKTHSGMGAVFLENYWRLNRKESYLRYFELLAFSCTNITSAKSFFNSFVITQYYENIMEDLLNFWGYEFFPTENRHPYSFGGWVSPNFKSLNLSFYEEKPMVCYESLRAYYTIKAFPKVKINEKGDRIIKDPLSQIYGNNLNLNNKEAEFFYQQPEKFFLKKFRAIGKQKNFCDIEEKFVELRQREFDKIRLDEPVDIIFKRIYQETVKTDVDTDYFPPWEEKLCDIYDDINERVESFPYQSENPRLSYIKYWNPRKFAKADCIIPDSRLSGKGDNLLSDNDYKVLDSKLSLINSDIWLNRHLYTARNWDTNLKSKQMWNNPKVVSAFTQIIYSDLDKVPMSEVTRKVDEKDWRLAFVESLPYNSVLRKVFIRANDETKLKIYQEQELFIQALEEITNEQREEREAMDRNLDLIVDEDDSEYLMNQMDTNFSSRSAWVGIRVQHRVLECDDIKNQNTFILEERDEDIIDIHEPSTDEEEENEETSSEEDDEEIVSSKELTETENLEDKDQLTVDIIDNTSIDYLEGIDIDKMKDFYSDCVGDPLKENIFEARYKLPDRLIREIFGTRSELLRPTCIETINNSKDIRRISALMLVLGFQFVLDGNSETLIDIIEVEEEISDFEDMW
jgi:hypothetical protein